MGNAMAPANDNGDYQLARINNVTFGLKQKVSATLGNIASGAFFSLVIRSGATWDSHIRCIATSGYMTLARRNAGVDTGIGSDSFASLATGDVLSLEISEDGLTVILAKNGTPLITATIGAGEAPTGANMACGFYGSDTTENATITQFTATDA
jgi:hypothetical protein